MKLIRFGNEGQEKAFQQDHLFCFLQVPTIQNINILSDALGAARPAP